MKKVDIDEIIDKMMEMAGYNARSHHLRQMGDYPWYSKYTWTEGEETEFKRWFVRKLVRNGWPKGIAEKEWLWFNLMYGLRIAATDE